MSNGIWFVCPSWDKKSRLSKSSKNGTKQQANKESESSCSILEEITNLYVDVPERKLDDPSEEEAQNKSNSRSKSKNKDKNENENKNEDNEKEKEKEEEEERNENEEAGQYLNRGRNKTSKNTLKQINFISEN
ncbi:hypothetical protein RFI_19130, partial [Reticulomyxa filosa]